jgi:hypothetical protein
MTMRCVFPLLVLGILQTAGLTKPLHAQLCGPVDETFQNDLCWIRYFASGNHGLTAIQIDSFRAFHHGVGQYTVSSEQAPWGGDYFGWKYGGIAKRWQAGNAYATPETLSWAAVERMDSAEIAHLSPAEKLDILAGNRDFRITRHELQYRGPFGNVMGWEGFCNGVRAAGALTPEPIHAVLRVSPDGIPVVFETTDIKALLGAAYYYLGDNNNYAYIGDNRTAVDPNAGAFDIALRMLLGRSDRVFFMDAQPGEMIFNHTIVGYDRKLVGETPALADGSRTLAFETTVYHMGEVTMAAMAGETRSRVAGLDVTLPIVEDTYSYELTVDGSGRIVDGRWVDLQGFHRPDQIWFGSGDGADSNYTPDSPGGAENGYRGNPHLQYPLLMELLQASRAR